MADTIRLYGLQTDSIVDGPGYRTAIFTQGCPHGCVGCHNPGSHPMDGGTVWTLNDVERKFTGNPLLSGITLSGGEPFMQADACAELARRAHRKGLTVWLYSGFTFEQLGKRAESDEATAALLREADVLVDGRFVLGERSLELRYCGSRNQRVIDLAKTRERGEVTLYQEPSWC